MRVTYLILTLTLVKSRNFINFSTVLSQVKYILVVVKEMLEYHVEDLVYNCFVVFLRSNEAEGKQGLG